VSTYEVKGRGRGRPRHIIQSIVAEN